MSNILWSTCHFVFISVLWTLQTTIMLLWHLIQLALFCQQVPDQSDFESAETLSGCSVLSCMDGTKRFKRCLNTSTGKAHCSDENGVDASDLHLVWSEISQVVGIQRLQWAEYGLYHVSFKSKLKLDYLCEAQSQIDQSQHSWTLMAPP